MRAVAAEFGDRAGIVVSLQRDMLDPHHLLAVLGRADCRDIELQPVQVELDVAVGGLVLHRRAEIVDVELGRLLGVVRLDVDVSDLHRHARLLLFGCAGTTAGATGRAWQSGAANSTIAMRGTAMSSTGMSTARELANFLTGFSAAELPAQTLDHAAMLIASTIASAAMGCGIKSAEIIRDM